MRGFVLLILLTLAACISPNKNVDIVIGEGGSATLSGPHFQASVQGPARLSTRRVVLEDGQTLIPQPAAVAPEKEQNP